jgi:hypothetical protein
LEKHICLNFSEVFGVFNPLRCRVAIMPTKTGELRSRRWGIIEFSTKEMAERFIKYPLFVSFQIKISLFLFCFFL